MTENQELHNEETTMQEMLDSAFTVEIGDTVTGEVLTIEDNQVIVGIQGAGVEGVIPQNELSAQPVENVSDVVNVGDVLELVVIKQIKDKENGSFLLSRRRIEAQKVWKEIQEKFENGETITAPVKSAVKGGLVVDAGVRGFVPASMVEDFFVEDFSVYEGKELEYKIIEVDPAENRLILSHRAIAEAEKAEKQGEVVANLESKVGQVVEGKVARLAKFGAFIDLGGVDGLVHISEIAYEHVDRPGDYLEVGQDVKVKVLSVDSEEGRISLSIKDTLAGPWDNIEEKAPKGAELDGKVKRLVDFGAFVEVFPGVEGLVHISEIAHKHVNHPNEELKEGQDIKVKVLDVNPEDQRLSLSIKALQEAPAREEGEEGDNNYEGQSRSTRGDHSRFERPQAQAQTRAPKKRQPRKRRENTTSYSSSNGDSLTLGDLFAEQLEGFKSDLED